MKIIPIIKNAIILYCAIFTIGTLVNSIGVLYLGISSNPDVHGHIMIRANIALYITIVITIVSILMKNIIMKSKTQKNLLFKYSLACAIILVLIFIYIGISASGYLGNADDIDPNAFRDMNRSILLPSVIFAIIGFFIMKRKMPGAL